MSDRALDAVNRCLDRCGPNSASRESYEGHKAGTES